MSLTQAHILLLLAVLCFKAEAVTITLEVRNRPFNNRIFLSCKRDNGILDNAGYRRTYLLDGQEITQTFTDYETVADGSVMFQLTPSLEGNYRCLDSNNTVSTNYITLIAYPTPDPSFTYPQHHIAEVGQSSPALPCPFLPGLLLQHYTIQWWRGILKLDTSNPKYQVLDNFSLVVHDAVITDVSEGYFCKILVDDIAIDTVYTEHGPDISLTVDGGLQEVAVLNNTVVLRGGDVTLSCAYQGYPPPAVTWLVNSRLPSNSRYTTNEVINSSATTSISLQSTLTITDAVTSDTGTVQCISIDGDKVTSSNAILIVLDDQFTPMLAASDDGSIYLLISLSVPIPDVFSLKLRYTSVSDPGHTYDAVIQDSTFSHTSAINHTLTPDELPSQFRSFTLRVALQVYSEVGEYSNPSDPFQMQTTPTNSPSPNTDCVCDVSVYQAIIGVLAVTVILVLVAITAIIFVLCYYSSQNKGRRDPLQPITYHKNGSHIGYNDPEFGDDYKHPRSVSSREHSCGTYTSTSSSTSSPSHSGSSCHGDMMSRPSSQESYSCDHSTTVSPVHESNHGNHHHIYAEPDDPKQHHHRKGHSESPRTAKYDSNGSSAKEKPEANGPTETRGVMSPSRSEPLLDTTDVEASLASTVGLSASVAVTTNNHTTTPIAQLQGIPTTELATFQEYMGTIHTQVKEPSPDHVYEEAIADFEIID